MQWTKHIVSLIGLIIAKLAMGGISLSLTLIAIVLLAGMAVLAVFALAVCGACFILERIGWLARGWTDRKLDQIKHWARSCPHKIGSWKKDIKRQIIEYLRDEDEREEDPLATRIKVLQAIVVGLSILVAVLLVKYYVNLSLWLAVAVVAAAVGTIFLAGYYLLSILSGSEPDEQAQTETAQAVADPEVVRTAGYSASEPLPEDSPNEHLSMNTPHQQEMLKGLLSGRMCRATVLETYGVTSDDFEQFCRSLRLKGLITAADEQALLNGDFIS